MRIVRYDLAGEVAYGQLLDDVVYPLEGDIFGQFTIKAQGIPLAAVTLLAPVTPGTLYAIGLNYRDHVGELDFARDLPTEPISFIVANSAVTGPDTAIVLNESGCRIDEEGELVVVIGKTCANVSEDEALDYVFGYTCGNDVSNRARQKQDGQWLRGKSYPTYKPIGPWIETALDPAHLAITAKINNQVVQKSNTAHLLFSVPKLIAFLSSFTTLSAGDCIMTGTPQGVSALQNGDVVEITIEGIGTLKNTVLEA